MPYYNCKLSSGGGKNLDGLTVKNSGATIPTVHKEGGWSGTSTGYGSITIKFPPEIDLSQYAASGGAIDINDNSLSVKYTATMTGSAGYYSGAVTGNTVTLTKVNSKRGG